MRREAVGVRSEGGRQRQQGREGEGGMQNLCNQPHL